MTRVSKAVALAGAAVGLGTLSFLGGGAIGRLWRPPALTSSVHLARNPRPVPPVAVPGLDGRPISSADWPGQVTIVSFWATWCVPCREEANDFAALLDRYPGRLRVIGLAVDERSEPVRAWVAQQGVEYPVGMADAELQASFGGIQALPTSFVLDTDGRIVQRHVGLFPPLVYDLEVRALLGLRVDAIVERVDLALGAGEPH